MIIKSAKIDYGTIDETISADTIILDASDTSVFVDENSSLITTDKEKLAYFEENYFLLDGSFVLPQQNTTYNVGWESENLSDSSGNIDSYVEWNFAEEHYSFGIIINFPEDSIAKNFTITYYNGNTAISTLPVENNTVAYYTNTEGVYSWDKVRITFSKVNPLQRARISYVVFGLNREITENLIISISASKATDIVGDYNETGEFQVSFFNDNIFNVDDIRDLPVEIQQGLTATVYIKKDDNSEFELFHKYYVDNTRIQDDGKVITLSGGDELYRLNNTVYYKGIVYLNGRSLYDWAEAVASDAGVNVQVDSSFRNIISTGYITEVPHREAFRLIAEAGCGFMYVDENGVIQLATNNSNNDIDITQDDIVNNTYSNEDVNKYLGLNVSKFTFAASATEIELGYLDEILLTAEYQDLDIVYSQYPVNVNTVQVFVNANAEIESGSIHIYSDRIKLRVRLASGAIEDTTFVTVTGVPYNSAITVVSSTNDDKNVKKIENNQLITGEIANNVVHYQSTALISNYRHEGEIVTDKNFNISDIIKFNDTDIIVEYIGFELSAQRNIVTVKGIEKK